ncbi:hypothetical protein BDK51DRAFT_42325 [Blyttiomyces helicus]|uniref:Uncharacterized protein n=1 Tax=Blyttiomyces helicus TaxID=388810 RepID=A0A4P9WJM8_9FUNG|nr:hypothetical protein BDK51DRAFT_42325 [Blyttiomyces helicus]|eukprot:RKO92582.1 hypothetical protein BDK51DRAFT_42325 [Blyttiomyces helicus]
MKRPPSTPPRGCPSREPRSRTPAQNRGGVTVAQLQREDRAADGARNPSGETQRSDLQGAGRKGFNSTAGARMSNRNRNVAKPRMPQNARIGCIPHAAFRRPFSPSPKIEEAPERRGGSARSEPPVVARDLSGHQNTNDRRSSGGTAGRRQGSRAKASPNYCSRQPIRSSRADIRGEISDSTQQPASRL